MSILIRFKCKIEKNQLILFLLGSLILIKISFNRNNSDREGDGEGIINFILIKGLFSVLEDLSTLELRLGIQLF